MFVGGASRVHIAGGVIASNVAGRRGGAVSIQKVCRPQRSIQRLHDIQLKSIHVSHMPLLLILPLRLKSTPHH